MEPVKKASIKMQTPAQIAWKDVALLTRLTMSIRISQLSFEHHRTALGIGEAQPRISWRFDGSCSNWTQSGYALEVSRLGQPDVEVFRVGKSSDSILVPWPSVALSSGESASVRVKAFGANGQPDTPWSKAASVEAGLLHEQDWQDTAVIASTKPTNTSTPHQPTLFRKAFSVPGNIASARLYITAYGLYEAEINGQRIGDAVLAPGWQSYDHRLVYDTYDVTAQLRSGKNVIGAQVGEGWFSGRLGFDGGERNIWGDTIGLQALLVILTKDNKVIRVPTDLSWTASTGPIITSEIYNGEAYDSRLEQVGWSTQDFRPQSASKWVGVKALTSRNAVLTAPDGPPIRRVGEVQLQNVIITPSGKTVLDFGQNLVGWLRLQVSGPAGQTIKLTHVEGMAWLHLLHFHPLLSNIVNQFSRMVKLQRGRFEMQRKQTILPSPGRERSRGNRNLPIMASAMFRSRAGRKLQSSMQRLLQLSSSTPTWKETEISAVLTAY